MFKRFAVNILKKRNNYSTLRFVEADDYIPLLGKLTNIETGNYFTKDIFESYVTLVVNTCLSSELCTQLTSLQELYSMFHNKGLQIIAVPSNDFSQNIFSDHLMIKNMYRNEYGIKFLISQIEKVKGKDAHPLFYDIAERYGETIAPSWNFEKFLFNPIGELIGVYPYTVDPLDETLIEYINDSLSDLHINNNKKEKEIE